jgi:hypothetical protein
MRVMEADGVEVEEGDMVCVRTGTAQMILDMGKNPDNHLFRHSCAKLDGRDEKLLAWITQSRLVAIICDNIAVEASPSRPAPARVARSCRSTPIACSSSASISARSGCSAISPTGCAPMGARDFC